MGYMDVMTLEPAPGMLSAEVSYYGLNIPVPVNDRVYFARHPLWMGFRAVFR